MVHKAVWHPPPKIVLNDAITNEKVPKDDFLSGRAAGNDFANTYHKGRLDVGKIYRQLAATAAVLAFHIPGICARTMLWRPTALV